MRAQPGMLLVSSIEEHTVDHDSPTTPSTRRRRRIGPRPIAALIALAVTAASVAVVALTTGTASAAVPFEIQSLSGSGNNVANPTWGQAGTNYSRMTPTRYADGIGTQIAGPNTRFVSNRIFNDSNQNLFSERGVTQWGFVWGQFMDHTFGLRRAPGVGDSPDPSSANIDFDPDDPLEAFTNTLGNIPFTRSSIAPGTGTNGVPREQVNTVSSYIDAFSVYSGDTARLEWMREGPVDGNMANNRARLLLTGGHLPPRTARGNAATAPAMDVDGRLAATPTAARVAGDVRANENIGLTATHTLFAREHNRIVDQLSARFRNLSEEDKFQIARRVVIAELQRITYEEWLPALGIRLPAYSGYRANVNANLTNEFATAAYRAHSMIHGEFELEAELDRYSPATLDALEALGVELAIDGDEIEIAIPLNLAFFNPQLLEQVQLGPMLQGIGLEAQYKNDEQIDNQLRSVLFRIPVSGNPECLDGPELPACFNGVVDLGAIDIERGRDHGLGSYNQLRRSLGLRAKSSFTEITGESTSSFPSGTGINNPNSIDFVRLFHLDGSQIPLDSELAESSPIRGDRRTTVAARLRAIFGSVDNVDAFTGMLAERHVSGADFGETMRAAWARQFQALRDGDRFFYLNQQAALNTIRNQFGIDSRHNLGDIIALNTDIARSDLAPNVFFTDGNVPPTSCAVRYRVTATWVSGGTVRFQSEVRITNTGSTPLNTWTLRFFFANGQNIDQIQNAVVAEQVEGHVALANTASNPRLDPGRTVTLVFNATRGSTNNTPALFNLNTTNCARV
jgi:hypothetical protein